MALGFSGKHGLWPAARGNYNVWRLLIWTGAIFIIIIFLGKCCFKVSLNLVASTEQHLDLLDCIQERNLEKLKEHLKKNLEWSLKLLLDNMEL